MIYKILCFYLLAFTCLTFSAQESVHDQLDPRIIESHVLKAAPDFPINAINVNGNVHMVSDEKLMEVRMRLVNQRIYPPYIKDQLTLNALRAANPDLVEREQEKKADVHLYQPKTLKKFNLAQDDYGYFPRKFRKNLSVVPAAAKKLGLRESVEFVGLHAIKPDYKSSGNAAQLISGKK